MKGIYNEFLQELRKSSMAVLRRLPKGKQAGKLTISEVFSVYLIDMLDGPSLKLFAETMGISQPNATYKVNTLMEKGYVEKLLSETDRRETRIYTTRKAKKIIQDVDSNPEMMEQQLRSRFTEQQLQTASEVFRVVLELMDRTDNENCAE